MFIRSKLSIYKFRAANKMTIENKYYILIE